MNKPSHQLNRADDAGELTAAVPAGCDVLVIDHYGLDRRYESACRSWAKRIFVIDDLADRDHDCDALLDQTVGRSASAYAGRVSERCRLLLGSGYALLRPAFAEWRRRRSPHDGPPHVLIAMGTSDPGNNLVPIIAELAKLPVVLHVVVGSSAPGLKGVRAAAQQAGASLHVDAPDMARLMAEADIAVLAAGTTTWEAAAMGLPMILLVTANNQAYVASSMGAANAAVVARNLRDVGSHVAALIGDESLRRSLAHHAFAVCDGYGARRVAIQLHPEQVRDGGAVAVRAARHADAELMLAWQRHPLIRQFARNPAIPTEPEHLQWLDRKLSDPRCIFNLILCDEKPAGVLRLDRANGDVRAFEISILVAPEEQRRGIARAALQLARRLVPRARLLAHVLAGNIASQRLFERAGFAASGAGWFVREPSLTAAAVA
jgi:UDP-2,4-diacetamido-2,4,6-trideoxy-beta-L-altropyranose hydrolase